MEKEMTFTRKHVSRQHVDIIKMIPIYPKEVLTIDICRKLNIPQNTLNNLGADVPISEWEYGPRRIAFCFNNEKLKKDYIKRCVIEN